MRTPSAENHIDNVKKCPYCGNNISGESAVCEHCGKLIEEYITVDYESQVKKDKTKYISWLVSKKRKILTGAVIVGLLAGSWLAFVSYGEIMYIQAVENISADLNNTTKVFAQDVHRLSRVNSRKENDDMIDRLREQAYGSNKEAGRNITFYIPGKYEEDNDKINSLIKKQQKIYSDTLDILQEDSDSDVTVRLDQIQDEINQYAKAEKDIQIADAQFDSAQYLINIVDDVKKYRSVKKNIDDREKNLQIQLKDAGKYKAESIAEYNKKKSDYDKQIIAFSEQLNLHLQTHPNFKNTDFDRKGSILFNEIKETKTQLVSEKAITDINKDKLLSLYELELIRIQKMVEGVKASKDGKDYLPYFKEGTEAAYQFDDENAAYENLQR